MEIEENSLKVKNSIEILSNEVQNISKTLNEEIEILNNNGIQVQKIKSEKNSVTTELDNQNRYENELKYKIEILERAIETDSGLSYAVKSVLHNPRLSGIKGIIGKLIDVDETYTTAIDIALGGAKEYIVTESRKDAKEAIEYLKMNNLGRATFFPMDVIEPRRIDSVILSELKNTNGFISIAADLATYDKAYENIILNQLGNVIVARSIDDANIISEKIKHRYKVVTLDGELVNVGGSMTGGKFKNKANNILNQKYELDDLNRKLEETILSIKLKEEKINELDYNLKHIEENNYAHTTKKKTIFELKNKESELNKEISHYSTDLELEHNKIMNEYYEELKRKETYENKLESLNNSRKTLSNLIEETESSIKRSNSSFNKLQSELKSLEISVNKDDVKLDNLLNTLNEDYSLTFERAKKLYKLEIPENEARIKVTELKNTIKNLGVVNVLAIEEFEKVNERFEFLTSQNKIYIKLKIHY